MQRAEARIAHCEAGSLRKLIHVILAEIGIGVGAFDPAAFEVALKENVTAGFRGNSSDFLDRCAHSAACVEFRGEEFSQMANPKRRESRPERAVAEAFREELFMTGHFGRRRNILLE